MAKVQVPLCPWPSPYLYPFPYLYQYLFLYCNLYLYPYPTYESLNVCPSACLHLPVPICSGSLRLPSPHSSNAYS